MIQRFPVGKGAWIFGLFVILLCGCAAPRTALVGNGRGFDFQRDTFAFTNELRWEYQYDANGKWTTRWRDPPPTYGFHCFVLARSARQFFFNARFDASLPIADERTYRHLIRRVVSSSPRHRLPQDQQIVIPGYGSLRQFSESQEKLLKEECGGAWRSYVQRGHWRMIFPFTRRQQARVAEQLLREVQQDRAPVLHLVRFPELLINHAVVLFDAKESGQEIEFIIYDPNRPAAPSRMTYDRSARSFHLEPNAYFPGGRVDVYEVYHRWNY